MSFFSLGVTRCKWVLLAEQADAMDIEKLETVDIFGKKHIKAFNRTESVDYYSIGSGEWRAA